MSASPSVDEATTVYSNTGGGQQGGTTSMPVSDPGGGGEGGGESVVETLKENRRGLVDSDGGDSAERAEMNAGEEGDAAGADEISGAVVPEGAEAGDSSNGTGIELLQEKVAAFEEKGQGDVDNEVKEHGLVDECFQNTEVGNLGSRGQEMGDGCNGDQELIADAPENRNIGRIALKEAKAEGLESVADLGGNLEEGLEIRNGTEPMKENESCPEKKASTMNDGMSGDLVDKKAQVIVSNVCPSELVAEDELDGDQKLKLDVKEEESVMGFAEAAATGTGGAVEVDGLEGEPANGGTVDVVETGNKTEFLEEDESYTEKEQSEENDVKGHDLVDKQLQAKEGVLGPKGLEMEDGLSSKQKLGINVEDGENVVECEKGTEVMKKQITNQNPDCKIRSQDLVCEHLQAPEGDVDSIALETANKLGGDEKLEAGVGDAGSGVGSVKIQAAVVLAIVESDRSEGVACPGPIQVGFTKFSNETELTEGVLSCPEEDKSVVGEVTDLQAAEGALIPKVLETDNILDDDQKPEPSMLEVACLSGASNNLGGEEAERLESLPELGRAQHKVPETSNGTELSGQAVSCAQKNQSRVTQKGGHDLADAHVQASEGDHNQNQSVLVESTAGNKDMKEGLFLGSNQDKQIWSAGCGTEVVEGSMVSSDQDRDHEASVSQTSLVNTNQNNQEVGNAIHGEETKEVDPLPVDDAIIEQADHVVEDSDLAESVVDAALLGDKYPSNKNARDELDIITADGNSVLFSTIMGSESRGRQLVDENTSGKGDITMTNSCPDLESEFADTCPLGVQTADTRPLGSVLKDSKSSVTPSLLMVSELSVSGNDQEREPQSNGLLVERGDDTIAHEAESSPDICRNMDKESRVLKDETSLPEVCCEKENLAQVAEADKKAPLLVDSVTNVVTGAGGTAEQNVKVDEQGHSKMAEKQVVKRVSIRPRTFSAEKEQHASYFLPLQDKDTFSISDLVWGKVKSHPWWPGQIFDPSDASDLAMKYQKKDHLLVAYFGDKTFAWCEEPQMKPFETYFSQMEKQSISEAFVTAVNDALGEVSRRTELGMTCFCLPEGTYVNIKYQTVENAGIREGISRSAFDRSLVVDYFEPGRLLGYIEALAQLPTGGANRLELVIAQAQLKALYQSKGYPELPVFQTGGGLMENDTEVASCGSKLFVKDAMEDSTPTSMELNLGKRKRGRGRPSNKEKRMLEDAKKQKNLSELMEENIVSPLANDGKIVSAVKIDDDSMSLSSYKKRKVIDFDSDYSERTKKKRLDSLGDLVTKSSPAPISSFKVGECIRRVASQLTGSPPILRCHGETFQKSISKAEHRRFDVVDTEASTHTDVENPRIKTGISGENTSLDQMLSQLCLAARDPLKGYSFLSMMVSFFTDFRNFCASSSSKEKKIVQKIGGKRGRKRTVNTQSPSSDMSAPDHMQDSYWSDMIYHNSSTNDLKRKGDAPMRYLRKRRKSGGETSLCLSLGHISGTARHLQVGAISPKMKQALTTERSVITLEEKIVDECTPTALILSFNGSSPLPSQTDLVRIFSRYGPLKEAETEVQSKGNRVKVVFKKRADAEIAFSSAGKYSIFGPALVSYCLRYLPSTPSASPNTPPQSKNDAGSIEGGKLEVPDDASPNTLSQGKNDAIPIEGSNLEVPGDASPNTTPEVKNDAVPVEGGNTKIPGDASLNTTRVKKDEVLIKGGNLEVPEASPNTTPQENNDAVPTKVGKLVVPGSMAPNITPQNENDAVHIEGGNLEIPGSTFPKAKQLDNNDAAPAECGDVEVPDDAYANVMQDRKDAAPIEDGSLEIRGNTSPNITPHDNNDFPVIKDGSLEVPGYASPSTTTQDKNDATPIEDSSFEIPGNTYPNATTPDQNDAALVEGKAEISIASDIMQVEVVEGVVRLDDQSG